MNFETENMRIHKEVILIRHNIFISSYRSYYSDLIYLIFLYYWLRWSRIILKYYFNSVPSLPTRRGKFIIFVYEYVLFRFRYFKNIMGVLRNLSVKKTLN